MPWLTAVRMLIDFFGRVPSPEETAALKAAWDATDGLPPEKKIRLRRAALFRYLADYVDPDDDPRAAVVVGVVDQSDNGVSTIEVGVELPEGTRVRVVLPPKVEA